MVEAQRDARRPGMLSIDSEERILHRQCGHRRSLG
jgi:hypothetical protein